MGCGESRKGEFYEEELMISAEEENIGLSKIDCEEIDKNFHRFSIAFRLTGTQFLTACREMKLDMKEYGSTEKPLTKLFHAFKEKKGQYFNTRKLCALGALIGRGRPKDKAKVLFYNYDIEVSKSLDINELKVMITDILEIGLIHLPAYACNSQTDETRKIEVSKYNTKLLSVMPTFFKFYEVLIMNDEAVDITIETFLEMFNSDEMIALTNSSKLRKLAIAEHLRVIAPINLVRDFILESNN